jgi:geranylgeranyl diphosphate synthase type II
MDKIDELKDELDEEFNDFLTNNPQYNDILKGGKRLRPILVLDVANFFDPNWRVSKTKNYTIKKFALVLELIHCSSLIIDDLPSMDNDIYRRGELTFHAKYGQKSTYIMVYNLLNLIKKLIYEINKNNVNISLEFEELINNELNNLVLGQKYDLDENWKPKDKDDSRTLMIANLKTSSLFKIAFLGSYYLLNNENNEKNESIKNILTRLGLNIGLAFQLSDDFLDLSIDNKFNNYGLETSVEELKNKYIDFTYLVLKDLKDLNWNDNSIIYKIIDLMNSRFETKK